MKNNQAKQFLTLLISGLVTGSLSSFTFANGLPDREIERDFVSPKQAPKNSQQAKRVSQNQSTTPLKRAYSNDETTHSRLRYSLEREGISLPPNYQGNRLGLVDASISLPSFNNHKQSVQFSRKLTQMPDTLSKNRPISIDSQEYWFKTTGAALKKGIRLDISSPGSLVRISPEKTLQPNRLQNKSINLTRNAAIDLTELEIASPNGQVYKGQSAMSFKANAKQLKSTGFAESTTAFKIDQSLKAGQFQIKTQQNISDHQSYFIGVMEKNSPYRLKSSLISQQVLSNERMVGKIALRNNGSRVALEKATAKLVSPNGQTYPLKTKISQSGEIEINRQLNLPFLEKPGLWEIQVESQSQENGITIRRNSRLAFAYQPKTAQIVKQARQANLTKKGLSYSAQVKTSQAGRYELTGLLFVVDKQGNKNLVAEARSAKWLYPGQASIALVFENKNLPHLKPGQRFQLAYLGLNDQSRMSVLE